MKRHQYKATIAAPREKVWQVLWGADTYPQWTAPFAEGSQVETDWKKGSKIIFLDGQGSGMISMIAENIPNEVMSFRHLGILNNGVEDLDEARKKGWSGAIENYTLKTVNGKTELTIDQDMVDEHEEHFTKTWPKAIERLKSLSEDRPLEELVAEGERSAGKS